VEGKKGEERALGEERCRKKRTRASVWKIIDNLFPEMSLDADWGRGS